MRRTALLAGALAFAGLFGATPRDADAQFFFGGRGFNLSIGIGSGGFGYPGYGGYPGYPGYGGYPGFGGYPGYYGSGFTTPGYYSYSSGYSGFVNSPYPYGGYGYSNYGYRDYPQPFVRPFGYNVGYGSGFYRRGFSGIRLW